MDDAADDPDFGNAAYRALLARDARFDGRLFVGVTSTGIYCRPVCRVRTPRRANCRFFTTAAQAEAQAFRPCLKCRPEIAPGPGLAWSVMDASRTLARQAADALDAQAASGVAPALSALAARLGVSDRHLRRIFHAEHGVTPLQHLQTRRLLLAKQLLTDSTLPVAQVALASGFCSLRRFNAAFADSYRMSPGRLRRDAVCRVAGRAAAGGAAGGAVAIGDTAAAGGSASIGSPARAGAAGEAREAREARTGGARSAGGSRIAGAAGGVTVTLAYRAPYDSARLLRFFAQRAIPGVEDVDVDGARFGNPGVQRSVRAGVLSARAGWIEATFPPGRCQVRVRFSGAWARDSAVVVAATRRWLDLDASPQHIADGLSVRPAFAGGDRALPAADGLRLPGCLDGFELAVRAVLGQQVSVAAARTLAHRLVVRFGEPLDVAAGEDAAPWPGVTHAFASPETLAAAAPERIGELGIVRTRAAAIGALARAWPTLGALTAPGSVDRPAERLIDALCALPGIGPWTAHYVAMRALGWPDAFLPNDVALLKAMQRLFGEPASAAAPLRQREADAIAQAWRPWRSYAVLSLWSTLETAGPSITEARITT